MKKVLLPTILLVLTVTPFVVWAQYFSENEWSEDTIFLYNSISDSELAKPRIFGEHGVTLKKNAKDKSKTDIYIKNRRTGKKTFLITLDEVYRQHYHNVEFYNGNLYVIRRTGGDFGYKNNPFWTDELWRYDSKGRGVELYQTRGLDFRVSPNKEFIAVIKPGESSEEETLVFLNSQGFPLKIFTKDDLGFQGDKSIVPIRWAKKVFWVGEGFVTNILKKVSIDTNTFSKKHYDVSKLPIQVGEFEFNPARSMFVFSDYPSITDAEGREEFRASGRIVTLFIYDIEDKRKEAIATSVAEKFRPKWINETTVEYDDPQGEARIIKTIP